MMCWRLIFCVVVLAGAGRVWAEGPATAASGVGEQHWFGVAVENIPPSIARQLKLRKEQGLMVMAVMPASPAEKAGLRRDDLLIEVDGEALTSQMELARAANAMEETKEGLVVKASRITFLRDGDRGMVAIMPAVRPERLMVLNGDVESFEARLRGSIGASTRASGSGARAEDVRNYVFPNGAAAQVGPGYRMNLNDASTVTAKSIKEIVEQGKTVILVQETDLNGAVKNTISVGGKSYVVEAGKVDALPAELRAIGEQLLASGAGQAEGSGNGAVSGARTELTLGQRMKALEEQNEKLRGEVEALVAELRKEHDGGASGGK